MELLVIVADRSNPQDIYKDTKLYKRGMVIDVRAEGWSWGYQELNNPDFRILKTTDLDDATVAALLAPEDGFGVVDHATSTVRIRKNRLDLDGASTPGGFRAFIQDNQRQIPIYVLSHVDQLVSLMTAIPAVLNPLVL